MAMQLGGVTTEPVLRITVTDLASGQTETAEIPSGEYLLLATAPCHVAHTNAHANGTHVITIKGRTAR
jgi:hypothetical protein